MAQHNEDKTKSRGTADDIMHGLRELAEAIEKGVPLEKRFTVRTVSIPKSGRYSPTAVKHLRGQLGMSQAG